jgi:serine/threonine protein kinase
MGYTTRHLYHWLVNHFHNYTVDPDPLAGTYGLIWFLTTRMEGANPKGFAVKTIAPERLNIEKSRFDADYLRREFRIWLDLPQSLNVLPALGFDVATLEIEGDANPLELPVMRMPRRSGSLEKWVGSQSYSDEDRLVALAQAFNGLLCLYLHGIEGHGDLKPSNILYNDFPSIQLPENGGWPSRRCPWHIQVADFGWADAWVDLGFTNKVWRQYMAPERLDGQFVPALSDVFSMGIIAAEVLQGRLPCGKAAYDSDGKWGRWVEGGKRNLSGVASPRIRELIEQCLSANASDRPTPLYCLTEICNEIEEAYGYSIAPILELWRRRAGQFQADENAAWAARHSRMLDETQISASRMQIERRLSAIVVADFETCERWLALAEALEELLNAEPDSQDAIMELRGQAHSYLMEILGQVTLQDLKTLASREDGPESVRPFERFSMVITGTARLAKVDLNTIYQTPSRLDGYALSAIAFGAASESRSSGSSEEQQNRHLADAIRFAPQEPAPYYFRALWGRERALIRTVLSKEKISEEDRQLWVADLKKALKCDPEWAEPSQLLRTIRPELYPQ